MKVLFASDSHEVTCHSNTTTESGSDEEAAESSFPSTGPLIEGNAFYFLSETEKMYHNPLGN